MVIKNSEISNVLENINKFHPDTQFTYEVEENGKLPFLDILIDRNNNNNLTFEIYRKSTNVDRYIPSNSHHCFSQKMASFNCMIHRMLSIPMNTEKQQEERSRITEIAKVNGYGEYLIKKIIAKKTKKKTRKEKTTLLPQEKEIENKRIMLPYCPPLCHRFNNLFKKVHCESVYSSQFKLKTFLCNNKDKSDSLENSGIYSITCDTCEYKYIGQSRRQISVRWDKHNRNISKNEPNKSSVAFHYLENLDHVLCKENFKMEKRVNDKYKLDAYESIYMRRYRHCLMNTQPPPIQSVLFNLI